MQVFEILNCRVAEITALASTLNNENPHRNRVLGTHTYPASLPKGKRYNFMAGKDESTSERMLVQGLPAVNPPTS